LNDLCLEAFFDAFLEDVLLFGVVMAAATRDQQNAEGLGWFGECGA
jgi:hypothetical protein